MTPPRPPPPCANPRMLKHSAILPSRAVHHHARLRAHCGIPRAHTGPAPFPPAPRPGPGPPLPNAACVLLMHEARTRVSTWSASTLSSQAGGSSKSRMRTARRPQQLGAQCRDRGRRHRISHTRVMHNTVLQIHAECIATDGMQHVYYAFRRRGSAHQWLCIPSSTVPLWAARRPLSSKAL